MRYNTNEISKEIKDFIIKQKDIIKYGGICRRGGVKFQPLADLLYGHNIALDRDYIDKILPHLIEFGFIYSKMVINLSFIQKKVCSYFNVPIDKVKSNSRKGEIVEARRFIFKFGSELAKISFQQIGRETGEKDHSTVGHGIKTLNNLIETERKTKLYFEDLGKQLKIR